MMKKQNKSSTHTYTLIILIASMLISCQRIINALPFKAETEAETITKTTINKGRCYSIENMLICPQEKTVSCYEYFEEERGENHVWGYRPVPDKRIHYETSFLAFIGPYIFFKEQLKGDFHSLKIISINDSYVLCEDKEGPFVLTGNGIHSPASRFDISGTTRISSIAYRKSDSTILIIKPEMRTETINGNDLNIDFKNLQHVIYNIYVDSKALYAIQNGVTLVCKAGRPVDPIVKSNYLIYDKNVIYIDPFDYPQKMELNHSKIKCFHTGKEKNDVIITDGHRSYYRGTEVTKKIGNTTSWQQLSDRDGIFMHNEGSLIHTNKGYLLMDDIEKIEKTDSGEPITFDDLKIFNPETQSYEKIDRSAYRPLVDLYYVYKSNFYRYGMPFAERNRINADDLNQLGNTDFLTDGHVLINYKAENLFDNQDDRELTLNHNMVDSIDIQSLHIINPQLVMDTNNIYFIDEDRINIIPRDSLQIEIKLFTEHK